MSASQRWQVDDVIVTDSRTGMHLRVGFPAGEFDPVAGRSLAIRTAALFNSAARDREARQKLRRLAAGAAWPVAAALAVAAVLEPRLCVWLAAIVTAAAVGAVVAYVALRGRWDNLEALHERKDVAIDAAMNNAFEVERISGETPKVPFQDFEKPDTIPWSAP